MPRRHLNLGPLLERALVSQDGLDLWHEIQQALAIAVEASHSELYLYGTRRIERHLRRLEPRDDGSRNGSIEGGYQLSQLKTPDDHIANVAARNRGIVNSSGTTIA